VEWPKPETGGTCPMRMKAVVCSVDGREAVEVQMDKPVGSTEEAERFGEEVAEELKRKGAARILEEITQSKKPW
ncbi:porphobilinogen deaminase, partial [Ascosphaera acerosa]